MHKLYYLICTGCGEQLNFVEAGRDLDGFTVIQVDPCEQCQNQTAAKQRAAIQSILDGPLNSGDGVYRP